MSPKIFALALTATLFAGIVAQADESGDRYRRRPAPQQQAQQQPEQGYEDYDDQDYQQGGYQQQGGYAVGGQVVVRGGYGRGCCGQYVPPPMPDCCGTYPPPQVGCCGGGYPPPVMPWVPPPVAVPYGGAGGCRIIQNAYGWQVLINGQPVPGGNGRAWQQGQLHGWRARGCI